MKARDYAEILTSEWERMDVDANLTDRTKADFIDWAEGKFQEAIDDERAACAKVAAKWTEDAKIQADPGCMAAFSEGLTCTAPEGIAAAIRARGEG